MTNLNTGSVELTDRVFHQFVDMIYNAAGISLGENKHELVRSRLMKRLRALNLPGFESYIVYLQEHDPHGDEMIQLIDAISTNKTEFFRENQHFIYLTENVLPGILQAAKKAGSGRIRFWSAGCSSGEEPYTLAIIFRQILDNTMNWDAKILATDISTKVLHFAREGVYTEEKVKPVPPSVRSSSFSKVGSDGNGALYKVHPEIQKMVTFRRLNLMDRTFPFSGKFDVIFCRNVMIYFDRPTQEALVNRYYDNLKPGGYLFIGHSESLTALKTPFQFVRPTIYMR
jgi:chemotaxis protein methyltransferase CheR